MSDPRMEDDGLRRTYMVESAPDGYRLKITLSESRSGAGDWEAAEITIAPVAADAWLTAAELRSVPYARHLADARAFARDSQAGAANNSPFVRVGDAVPASFREDRRGGKERPKLDWALLAKAWVDSSTKRRRELPRIWSQKYGRTVATWRNDLARAKRMHIVERQHDDPPVTGIAAKLVGPEHVGHYLTDRALVLIYGEDIDVALVREGELDGAEEYLRRRSGQATDAERAQAKFEDDRRRRTGASPSPEQIAEMAQRKIDDWYSHPGRG